MSDQEQEDKELEEMRRLLEKEAEAEKAKAAVAVEEPPVTPSPEPIPSPAPETAEVPPNPVPQTPPPAKEADDPMEWAKKKGFKTPEDMARALLQKEQEFHQSRQKANGDNPPPPQNWQPRPDMGGGYPPPPYYPPPAYQRTDIHQELGARYNMDPEDVKRVMPLVVDAAEAIATRRSAHLERQLGDLSRSTQRNNELMTLMQDPAFRDNRVQKEVHAILDSDPSIFQRERQPLIYAYEKAMVNMARKQLQQGVVPETETPKNMPPVTAGGGNGSAHTSPFRVTDEMVASWTMEQQDAYFRSNGRTIPKR